MSIVLMIRCLSVVTASIFISSAAAHAQNDALEQIHKIQKNGIIIYGDNQKMRLEGIVLQKNGRKHISELAVRQYVKIHMSDESRVRGIAQGDIELMPGFFLARELVKSGHALMFPFYISGTKPQNLRELEAVARKRHAGIWRARKSPPMVQAEQAENFIGQYKIVTGKITKHDRHKGTIYLNFGKDWRKDFTVRAPEPIFNEIAEINQWPQDMTGKTIQCRGVLHQFYGAAIDLNHFGQCDLP